MRATKYFLRATPPVKSSIRFTVLVSASYIDIGFQFAVCCLKVKTPIKMNYLMYFRLSEAIEIKCCDYI